MALVDVELEKLVSETGAKVRAKTTTQKRQRR